MSANSRFLNLDTDGTLSANSDEIVPSQKAVKTYVDAKSSIDNNSVTRNSNEQIQTIGVIDQNAPTTAIKKWTGTKAEYDAIATKDPNTDYEVTDDNGLGVNVADTDLSNLSATGEEKFDGSWNTTLIMLVSSDTAIAADETKTYSLSSYLEAGKVYEVLLSVNGYTSTTSGQRCNISVNGGTLLCGARTQSTTAALFAGASVIVVSDRTISIHNIASNAGTLTLVRVTAYRRVK